MKPLLRTAFSGPVVRRGIKFAVVVGAILVAINHGDAIMAGAVTPSHWVKIALTGVVPYCVSVLSSIGVMRDAGLLVNDRGIALGASPATGRLTGDRD